MLPIASFQGLCFPLLWLGTFRATSTMLESSSSARPSGSQVPPSFLGWCWATFAGTTCLTQVLKFSPSKLDFTMFSRTSSIRTISWTHPAPSASSLSHGCPTLLETSNPHFLPLKASLFRWGLQHLRRGQLSAKIWVGHIQPFVRESDHNSPLFLLCCPWSCSWSPILDCFCWFWEKKVHTFQRNCFKEK